MEGMRPAFDMALIAHLARTGKKLVDASTGADDLRHRQVIALTLLSQRGAMSQQAFGDALSLDPSNVVGLLNELEDRSLISRRRDPSDRRRHIVELSRAGETELEAAQERLAAVEDQIFRALSTQDRAVLHELLERAVGADPDGRPADSLSDCPPAAGTPRHRAAPSIPGVRE
ncbi:MarR family transcriptional regulator [Streptosporangium sp. NPDC006013]|uniref:MarR family winged helix-turn-helix transcriptional regulator n=1 Tax=Streptosporangium sp. NPDC006013 TaxID=3155596 RepID=UPI0033BDC002